MKLLLLLLLAPNTPERAVSPSGDQYVLVYQRHYEFYRRSPDHPVLLDERLSRRRPEDRRLFSGKWKQRPRQVRVLDRQPAFIAWGRRAALYARGKRQWDVHLDTQERSPWVSEQLDLLVLDLHALRLGDGSLIDVASKIYLLGTRHGKSWERHSALESVSLYLPDGTVAAMERLMRDKTQEIDMQSHAAAVARVAGSKVDTMPLFRAGLDSHAARYLVPYAYDVLGDEALPLLEWALRRTRHSAASAAHKSLAKVGPKATLILVRALRDKKLDPLTREGAARALGVIRDARALSTLAAAALEPSHRMAKTALGACISTGGSRLPVLLSTILEQGSAVDDQIVYYFMKHPTPEAVPGLLAELKRAPKATPYMRQIVELISSCRRRTRSLRR